MKIQKKHAVALTKYMWEYLDKGYYPVDDTTNESEIIAKVLGFGLYHGLIEEGFWETVNIESIPKPKKTARIDLTSDEGCAILEMMSESLGIDIEDIDIFKALRRYINKEFVIDADRTENSKRQSDS